MSLEGPAMDLGDPSLFAAIIRADWCVTRSWNRLHALPHGPWPLEWHEDIAWEWQISRPVLLACGRTAGRVQIPGWFSRLSLPRCTGCCRAAGMPQGTGSPKNDDECRRLLGLD